MSYYTGSPLCRRLTASESSKLRQGARHQGLIIMAMTEKSSNMNPHVSVQEHTCVHTGIHTTGTAFHESYRYNAQGWADFPATKCFKDPKFSKCSKGRHLKWIFLNSPLKKLAEIQHTVQKEAGLLLFTLQNSMCYIKVIFWNARSNLCHLESYHLQHFIHLSQ